MCWSSHLNGFTRDFQLGHFSLDLPRGIRSFQGALYLLLHAKLSLHASAQDGDAMAMAPATSYSSKMTTCKNLSAVLEEEAKEEAATFSREYEQTHIPTPLGPPWGSE